MFPLYSGLSRFISIHHQCHIVCMILMHLLCTLNRSLFQLFCFLHCLITRWRFVPRSSTYAIGVILLRNLSALAAYFEQVTILVICFLHCVLTRHWFVSCQHHMCHQFHLLRIGCWLLKSLCVGWLWTGHCFSFIVSSTVANLDID